MKHSTKIRSLFAAVATCFLALVVLMSCGSDEPKDEGLATGSQPVIILAIDGLRADALSSYGALAQRIGAPLAARAVGGALGRNPLPLVVPCHRVLQQDGGLGGFSAGPALKRRLLELEGYLLPSLGVPND